jgi:hypothetical protein
LTGVERTVLRALRKNIDLIILSADKDDATAVLNTVEYIRKIGARGLAKGHTATAQGKTSFFLRNLHFHRRCVDDYVQRALDFQNYIGSQRFINGNNCKAYCEQHWKPSLPAV